MATEPPGGVDGAADDVEADPGDAGDLSPVGARIFQILAGWFVALAVFYALVSDDEWAGVVLLLLSGGLSLLTGAFLGHARRHGLRQELEPADYERPGELYLPTSSVHPVIMGGGIVAMAAGLAFGIWVLLPGLLVFLFGLYGWVKEGRART